MGMKRKPFYTPWPTQHQAKKDRQRAIRALGRPLARSCPVHHHTHTQLVICENAAYHQLLHRRTVAVRFGLNPNTHRACYCCQKPFEIVPDKPLRKMCLVCSPPLDPWFYVEPDWAAYPATWGGKTAEELGEQTEYDRIYPYPWDHENKSWRGQLSA